VRFTGLQAQLQKAAFNGLASVNISGRQPQYEIAGKLAGMPWRAGTLDAEGALTTSGTALDLLSNMTAKGSFRGKDIELNPPDAWDRVEGCFEWAWDRRNPKLRLNQLVVTTDGDTYLGSAEMQDNGVLVLHLSDGTKQIQASGALWRGDALKPLQ
jgi:hypothetical protein